MSKRIRNDDGVTLIIAILIITVVAVVTGALLSQGATNFKATVALRQVAGSAYAADTAAKIAIGDLQLGENASDSGASYPNVGSGKWVYDNYADGSGCFGLSGSAPRTSIELKNVYPATGSIASPTSARVDCAPVTGSGIFGSGQGAPITTSNSPGRALTLLGDGSLPGDGMTLKPLGAGNSNEFVVAGGLAVNDSISVSNGGLLSSSYIWAHNGCSGTITSTPAAVCNHATVTDPAYSATTASVPNYQPIPAGCTFQPGYYDNADALTTKTDACPTSTFTPGTYYFDFHNNNTDATANSTAVPSSSDVWSISNTIIGGTTTASSAMPGSCVSPIESPTANGVQFIFGGDSRVSLGGSANVELCASSSTTNPQIALFGLDTSGASAAVASPAAITAGTVVPTGTPSWNALSATPANLATVDGSTATWVSPNSGSPTATLTMTGFAPGSSIPAGSMLASAQLQVTHSETITSGTPNKISVKVDAGASTQTFNPVVRSALTTDSLDVKTVLSNAVHDGTLATAIPTVTINETGKNTTLKVDAVRLVLTYYPPSMRGQNSSATGIPSNCIATGGCDFLTSGNNSGAVFVIDGLTYIPNGSVNVNPGNGGGLIAFRYGLIARGLNMKGQPQYTFGFPVVSIPESGPGLGTNVTAVDLKVYLCVGQATCASGGQLALTSRVKITDPPTVQPSPSTRKIDVLSWSDQR